MNETFDAFCGRLVEQAQAYERNYLGARFNLLRAYLSHSQNQHVHPFRFQAVISGAKDDGFAGHFASNRFRAWRRLGYLSRPETKPRI